MAFTVEDFEDLYRLLSEHPEWRTRLRPLILGDEYVQLPERLAGVEAQLILLGKRMDQLVASQELLIDRMDRIEGRMGNIEGNLRELRYAGNLGNWFRAQLSRPNRLFIDDLDSLLAAQASGQVSEEDVDRVARADLIVRGTRREGSDELLLAVEVSTTINRDDVERAIAWRAFCGEPDTRRKDSSVGTGPRPMPWSERRSSRSSSTCVARPRDPGLTIDARPRFRL